AVAEVVRLIYQLTGRGGKPLIGALPSRPGEEPTQIATAARTQEMIGWHAAVSLAEGLKGVITHL
ncbi:MAG: hypothetical protein GY796_07160, partial [Chloroflexi bacterium]|nr:hypothetical protein [Chloroflexota bacterium]